MLRYTGHPLVDIGIATITAFAGKGDPAHLTEADLDAIADYMAEHYVVNPLKSFLTVAFPNSGYTNPAFEKSPDRRAAYAERVLRAYKPNAPRLSGERCIYTGLPAAGWALKDKDDVPPGRAYRQHIPLLTGEGVINFFPEGRAGLPVSGEALLALQALPLGCAKVGGRLLAVHSDDPELTLCFADAFLERNKRAILHARSVGDSKLADTGLRARTFLVDRLLAIERKRREDAKGRGTPASITAYYFTNSGQGADLQIYHLPMEITDFLGVAQSAKYRVQWEALCDRGWELTRPKRGQTEAPPAPRYNALYEELFQLPEASAAFIRCYFLRIPRRDRLPGDPRVGYSPVREADIVFWPLTELFLRKVVKMDEMRIQHIRDLGDRLAKYVHAQNDRRFFQTFLTARQYDDIRFALIRASVAEVKRGRPPLVSFEPYIAIFEEGTDLPHVNWRLSRDLVLIRMVEQLYCLGWLQQHAEELPEVAEEAPEETL
ncbi:MAG: type I-B CRISPR-associated protein Cas8b1/Cst1 [Anaerolineae bacterium]